MLERIYPGAFKDKDKILKHSNKTPRASRYIKENSSSSTKAHQRISRTRANKKKKKGPRGHKNPELRKNNQVIVREKLQASTLSPDLRGISPLAATSLIAPMTSRSDLSAEETSSIPRLSGSTCALPSTDGKSPGIIPLMGE